MAGDVSYIRLVVENLGDGTLFASSDDVPGLFIRGQTRSDVRSSAIKAVKVLYLANRQMDVDVEATEEQDVLRVEAV